jgi:hypothetical protein
MAELGRLGLALASVIIVLDCTMVVAWIQRKDRIWMVTASRESFEVRMQKLILISNCLSHSSVICTQDR